MLNEANSAPVLPLRDTVVFPYMVSLLAARVEMSSKSYTRLSRLPNKYRP